MFSYTKALLALVLAFVCVISTWFWFQNRSNALANMKREKINMQSQIVDSASYVPIIADLGKRMEALETEKKDILRGLVPADNEGPLMIQAVVDTATSCSIRMTSTSESQAKGKSRRLDVSGMSVNVVSYNFALKGSYVGLVKFFQGMKKWQFNSRLESLDVVSQGDRGNEEELEIAIVITVFSMAG
jgi:Tfp pilus assembly protein PilO